MNIKQTVILLSVNQFRITNEKTGEVENEGCTARYLLTEDMEQCEDLVKSVKGHRPAKATLPFDNYSNFQLVPALYEVTLSYSVDSSGKAAITPTNFTLLSGIVVNKAAGGKINLHAKET